MCKTMSKVCSSDYFIMASFPIYTHHNSFERFMIPRKLNIVLERYFNSKRFNNAHLNVMTYFMCWVKYDMINLLNDGNLEITGLSTNWKNNLPKDQQKEDPLSSSILQENIEFICDIWSKMSEEKQRIMLRNAYFL